MASQFLPIAIFTGTLMRTLQKGKAMQHIAKNTPLRRPHFGFTEVLIYSITNPGWLPLIDFMEESLELYPGRLACPGYGCKVYKHRDSDVRVIWHNNMYGCPLG